MKKVLLRTLQILLAFVALLAVFVLGSTAYYELAKRSGSSAASASAANPMATRLTGTECRVWTDSYAIPHIQVRAKDGSNPTDRLPALACLGFVQGSSRLWQMDFLRSIVRGRRTETFGNLSSLESDFIMRVLGLYERAENLYQVLPEDLKSRFQAFAYGVNQGYAEGRKSYEFAKLGYEPEPWLPQDSIALILIQSFSQTRRGLEQDVKEERWAETFGAEAERLFSEHGLPWETTIIKPEELPAAEPPRQTASLSAPSDIPALPKPEPSAMPIDSAEFFNSLPRELFDPDSSQGSNNWVVSPKLSQTGKAWLANDPHLGLKHPPFWHWSHLSDGTIDVIAAALPGTPAYVSGTNPRVAWGLTNAYLDVADIYHVPESELRNARTYRPTIWVKLWKFHVPFVFKTFRRTEQNLPVVPLPSPVGYAKVARWSGFDLEPQDFRGIFEIPESQSARAMDLSFARSRVPSWNFVFADTAGSIGFRAIGKVPKRDHAPPFGIAKISAAELAKPWDYLGTDEMPHLLDPARGFIVTANNPQWPQGPQAPQGQQAPQEHESAQGSQDTRDAQSPQSAPGSEGAAQSAQAAQSLRRARYHTGRANPAPFRAFRIEELIRKTPLHDYESMRAIQCDDQAIDARFFLTKMLELEEQAHVHAALSSSAPDATLESRRETARKLLGEWEKDGYRAQLECRACAIYRRWLNHVFEETSLDEASLYRKLVAAGNEPNPNIAQVLLRGLRAAIEDLPGDPFPKWGEVHRAFFTHLSESSLFKRDESLGTPGDKHSVSPGDPSWRSGKDGKNTQGGFFEQVDGASHRLIVELSSPPKVYMNLTGTNADVERPSLSAPGSPYQNWVNCVTPQVPFPIDFSQLPESETKVHRLAAPSNP